MKHAFEVPQLLHDPGLIEGLGASAGARAWAAAQRRGAPRAGAAIASGVPRAWGAERERSASTHAMR
eukprot:2637490-Pleurochrysis_carterae.AAC.1